MSLYTILPAGAQSAYSELYEVAQQYEVRRSISGLNGSVQFKSIAGKKYAYYAYRDALDGRVQQFYIGPDSPQTRALADQASQEPPVLLARHTGAAISHGCASVTPKHLRIIRQLADARFFRAGGLLIGSHAYQVLGNMLGVTWQDATKTQDVDFAHAGRTGNISVALPADINIDVHSAIDALEMGFLPSLNMRGDSTGSYASTKEPDLRLDFLTPLRRDPSPVEDPALKVALQPIKFLDYLIEQPAQAVVFGDGGAAIVNVPAPGRFALHKLLVAAERPLSEQAKATKDLAQAAAVTDFLMAHLPHELSTAWSALDDKGHGWSKRVERSLTRLGSIYPDVHVRLREFYQEEVKPNAPHP